MTDNTFRSMDKKYYNVILLSMIPILFQYVQTLIKMCIRDRSF